MEKEILNAANGIGLDPMQVLEELSKYVILSFNPNPSDREEWPHTDKENEVFFGLMKVLFDEYRKGIKTHGWTDPWGQCYESMLARSKASMHGIFYTPPEICDLITDIVTDEKTDGGKKINCGAFGERYLCSDPTCGSGRNLLATAAKFIGKPRADLPYFIGEDLDPMCCRMTAINLMAHGVPGEVICHNTLSDTDKLNFGYVVNEGMFPISGGLPTIRMFTDKDRFVYFRTMRYKSVHPKQTDSELTLNFE